MIFEEITLDRSSLAVRTAIVYMIGASPLYLHGSQKPIQDNRQYVSCLGLFYIYWEHKAKVFSQVLCGAS